MRREDLAATLRVLGVIRTKLGRHEAALEAFAEGLTIMRALVGEYHREIALILSYSAAAREQLGQLDTAEKEFREAVRVADRAFGATHRSTIDLRLDLVEFLLRRNRLADVRERLPGISRGLEAAGIVSGDRLRERFDAVAAAAGS